MGGAGGAVFVKRDALAPPGFFAAEAAGLRWLAETATVPVPEVVAVDDRSITIARIDPGPPTAAGAERFGRLLSDLHAAGATAFGAPWPGFIGPLPLDNTPAPRWAPFFAEQRVLPYLRAAVEAGSLPADGGRAVERLAARLAERCGAAAEEGPSRIHGDLWSGNVLWDRHGTAWVIDPAAHGGHRESDLAMLALFGLPHLERVLAAYDEHRPLAGGWRERLPLHQLHPLLVHTVLFGASYGRRVLDVVAAWA